MMWKYVRNTAFFLLFFALGFSASAQNNQAQIDSLKAARKAQKLKKRENREPFKPYFSHIKIGTDLSHYANLLLDGDALRAEVTGELSLSNRLFFVLDAGYSSMRSVSVRTIDQSINYRKSADYTNTGIYIRGGVDYNLLSHQLKNESLFAGFRYGYCNFGHELIYAIRQDYWAPEDPTEQPVYFIFDEEQGMSAGWAEFVLGIKADIFEHFYVGFTLRSQFLLNLNDGIRIGADDIPGFGKTNDSANLIFSYHLYYRLPFGGKSQPTPENK